MAPLTITSNCVLVVGPRQFEERLLLAELAGIVHEDIDRAPISAAQRSTIVATASRCLMSAPTASAVPPASRIVRTTSSAAPASEWKCTATRAPSRASAIGDRLAETAIGACHQSRSIIKQHRTSVGVASVLSGHLPGPAAKFELFDQYVRNRGRHDSMALRQGTRRPPRGSEAR